MDIRSLANSATRTVNPNMAVAVRRSSGFTVGAGRKQVPTYDAAIVGPAQLQALDGEDLKQLEGLNVQGEVKAIFLRGILAGVIRPDSTGGDMVDIADGPFAGTWLVVKVIEGWPLWTKAAIVKQSA